MDDILILTKRDWTDHVQKEMFKQEIENLVVLGVLEVANDSEWVAPSFAQPKPKSNWVSVLSDLRNLNKQLKRKPYPMPNITEMLLELEDFQYTKNLPISITFHWFLA